MKSVFTIIVLTALSVQTFGQQMNDTMEVRAKEMHAALITNDKEVWKKFIQENYSQTLIEKPMKSKVEHADPSGSTISSSETTAGTVEAKAEMFRRLYNDFGKSKILSIKSVDEILEMILQNPDGLSGTFKLTFNKTRPYLIDALGIEVTAQH